MPGVLRTLCALLLEVIPNSGLPELSECMERIYEFYTTQPIGPSLQPVVERVPAKLGGSYVRPEFFIEEE